MRTLFLSILFLTAFFQKQAALAQPDSLKLRNWYVKISPQHLLVAAPNLEIERRLAPGGRHSVTLALRKYTGGTATIDSLAGRQDTKDSLSKVNGYGWEFMHRIYAKNSPLARKQYFAYGLNYHKFDLEYAVLGWGNVVKPDGLEYILYGWHPKQEQIKRYGLVAMFGLQQPIFGNRVVTDFYGGLGYHITYYSNPESVRYQTNIMDYGHKGLYLTLGFKLGYSFN